MTAVNKHKLQG